MNDQIKIGNRVRHIDGREGEVLSIHDHGILEVLLDEGGSEMSQSGYWQLIPEEKLTA